MTEMTELFFKALQSETFAILGTISSLISLILTFYVFLDVRKIRSYYVFSARVPDLIKKLHMHVSNLARYAKAFEQHSLEIEEELAGAEVVLESLHSKLDGKAKQSVAQLMQDIESYPQKRKDKNAVKKIYIDMTKIIGRVREIQEDRKWEV
ncbi:MAG: hypothetical protein ACPGWR_31150 [Ardenticatenaceae bacterium]